MTVKIKVSDPGPPKKRRDRSREVRVEGRWRLDFSRKSMDQWSEPIEQRRARTKAWLQHNYPHVLRTESNEE